MQLVSVVMPVYNSARFLRQAIESVLSQTYRNIELIMVDDCSTDESLQIMREYEAADERVCIIVNETNHGVARTRNRGIQAAKGEYIALLDSDDVWKDVKIERQIQLLVENNADIAYCSVDFIDEAGNKMGRSFIVPCETDYKEMMYRCYFICSTVVVKASMLKTHLFRTDYYHEDFLLWTELLALPAKTVGDQTVMALYRQINDSRSGDKVNAAKHRWKIYREALGQNLFWSSWNFVRYAFWGVVKYYI